ncbi:hypothetical protein CYMTET_40956 [Cymbomonas tetramitiformis]|uniref:Uncharacterized protein n=1 Tax=Cymbomonas tetramitiformis TaxID=36881 RepID=A0AAE0F2F4_9CHLO|nr:hypothetical protein CYMTET_40956 [Cymbomonas tetramitiformis]
MMKQALSHDRLNCWPTKGSNLCGRKLSGFHVSSPQRETNKIKFLEKAWCVPGTKTQSTFFAGGVLRVRHRNRKSKEQTTFSDGLSVASSGERPPVRSNSSGASKRISDLLSELATLTGSGQVTKKTYAAPLMSAAEQAARFEGIREAVAAKKSLSSSTRRGSSIDQELARLRSTSNDKAWRLISEKMKMVEGITRTPISEDRGLQAEIAQAQDTNAKLQRALSDAEQTSRANDTQLRAAESKVKDLQARYDVMMQELQTQTDLVQELSALASESVRLLESDDEKVLMHKQIEELTAVVAAKDAEMVALRVDFAEESQIASTNEVTALLFQAEERIRQQAAELERLGREIEALRAGAVDTGHLDTIRKLQEQLANAPSEESVADLEAKVAAPLLEAQARLAQLEVEVAQREQIGGQGSSNGAEMQAMQEALAQAQQKESELMSLVRYYEEQLSQSVTREDVEALESQFAAPMLDQQAKIAKLEDLLEQTPLESEKVSPVTATPLMEQIRKMEVTHAYRHSSEEVMELEEVLSKSLHESQARVAELEVEINTVKLTAISEREAELSARIRGLEEQMAEYAEQEVFDEMRAKMQAPLLEAQAKVAELEIAQSLPSEREASLMASLRQLEEELADQTYPPELLAQFEAQSVAPLMDMQARVVEAEVGAATSTELIHLRAVVRKLEAEMADMYTQKDMDEASNGSAGDGGLPSTEQVMAQLHVALEKISSLESEIAHAHLPPSQRELDTPAGMRELKARMRSLEAELAHSTSLEELETFFTEYNAHKAQ